MLERVLPAEWGLWRKNNTMAKQVHGTLDSAERLLKLRACLDPLSKNGEGELNLLDRETHECKESECVTLTTEHALKLELQGHEPCDSEIGKAFDGVFVVRQLVSVLSKGSGESRGMHAGDFQWRGADLVVEGSISGMTNVGTHRKPVFGDCQKCHDPGHMEGRLTGKVTRARDDRLLGCEVTAAYRLRFDPSEGFQNTGIQGTFEGLVVTPCGKDDGERGCLDFTTFPAGQHPNPWQIAGYEFAISNFDGTPAASADVLDWGPGRKGLNANYETRIVLPTVVSNVAITLIHFSSPATVRALNAGGVLVDSATMTADGVAQTLSLSGAGITTLVVTPPQNETLILEICI